MPRPAVPNRAEGPASSSLAVRAEADQFQQVMLDPKAGVLRDPVYQGAQVLSAGELDCLMAGAAEQMVSVDELGSNISDAAIFQMHPSQIA